MFLKLSIYPMVKIWLNWPIWVRLIVIKIYWKLEINFTANNVGLINYLIPPLWDSMSSDPTSRSLLLASPSSVYLVSAFGSVRALRGGASLFTRTGKNHATTTLMSTNQTAGPSDCLITKIKSPGIDYLMNCSDRYPWISSIQFSY